MGDFKGRSDSPPRVYEDNTAGDEAAGTVVYTEVSERLQIEILFALLNVNEDHPDYVLAQTFRSRLDQAATEQMQFVTMTSGC